MIADTTFLIHWSRETKTQRMGRARTFLASHRRDVVRTTIITVAELAVGFPTSAAAWQEILSRWSVYRLHDGVAQAAADVDRERTAAGQRIGENDTWIAGFCLYYREPVISLDAAAFDRVPGLRRLAY